MFIAVGLGLGAAFLFAAAATLQQRAARVATATHRAPSRERWLRRLVVLLPILAVIGGLVRTPLWLAGWVTNLIGFGSQALALHSGSVALVQPLLVTQLLFTLPLAAVSTGLRPRGRDWVAGAAICGGLGVFLSVGDAAPLEGAAERMEIALAGLCAVAVVAGLVAASVGRSPAVHSTLIAIAAGLCFAFTAVLIKLTATDLVEHGVVYTATDWPGYSLAVSTGVGLLLEQEAFAAGSLPAAVAAMTITNPIASYLIGVLAFHVTPPSTMGALAGVAGAATLLTFGVIGLAHSPMVRQDYPQRFARGGHSPAGRARMSKDAPDPRTAEAGHGTTPLGVEDSG